MKFENTNVFNIDNAIRGMRNPLNSWNKSDSTENKVGDNDIFLAQRLISAGQEHRKFMRQIFISVDITAPRYIWSEMDTYKINTTSNSCSTMHTLCKTKITKDMFDNYGVDDDYWDYVLYKLNVQREKYNSTKSNEDLEILKRMLPESFLQKRTWTANYEVIRNIYHQRKNHRLSHWNTDFVEWVKTLPYAEDFIIFNSLA